MCGIFLSIGLNRPLLPEKYAIDAISRRGPDSSEFLHEIVKSHDKSVHLYFCVTVLALRGKFNHNESIFKDRSRFVLCWNGEAWKFRGRPLLGNDTSTLFKELSNMDAHSMIDLDVEKEKKRISDIFSNIEGPYSFILYDRILTCVFFGRDTIGRRSLLIRNSEPGGIIVSSVPDTLSISSCTELQPSRIYCVDIKQYLRGNNDMCVTDIDFCKWDCPDQSKKGLSYLLSGHIKKPLAQRAFLPTAERQPKDPHTQICIRLLLKSLDLRLASIPRHSRHATGIDQGQKILRGSDRCLERIAVLFSGGLDCTLLARLSHEIVPLREPISLLNVAFENPKPSNATRNGDRSPSPQLGDLYEACPDRMTARRSLNELRKVCLGREWKFITINVSNSETLVHLSEIRNLMQPHKTEMDLSIAMALYFAARGKGTLDGPVPLEMYETPAKVLLSGLGADELFGGYVRHETAFRRKGLPGLFDELQTDFLRIGSRNLGRDDRVTAVWGREIRYPFLDEDFTSWSLQLPLSTKCAFGEDEKSRAITRSDHLEAGKHILRRAAWITGLRETARERKRAIQFGSRSAKMLNKKAKGTDIL